MGRKETFIKSGVILSLGALFMRTTGMALSVYLTADIGAEGMGLYSLIMSVYGFAVTFGSAGIHLAATRMTAEAIGVGEEPGKGVRVCAVYGIVMGGVGAVFLLLGADCLSSELLADARAAASIRVMALSLPFISLSAALGGFFTALRRAALSSAAQMLEQLARIAMIVSAMKLLAPSDTESSCVIIVAAGTVAEIFSCLVSFLLYLKFRRSERAAQFRPGRGGSCSNISESTTYRRDEAVLREPEAYTSEAKQRSKYNAGKCRLRLQGYRSLIRTMLSITVPVSIGSCIRSALVSIEHVLIPWGLRRTGASAETALSSYGILHGMALPVIFFPSAFLGAFASLIIPELAEADAAGRKREIAYLVHNMLSAALIFSIGTAGGLIYLSKPLGLLLYGSGEAAHFIRIIAPLVPIMYVDTAVDAILKGLGFQRYNMVINVLDATISVALVYLLLPRYGINGYIPVIFVTETFNTVCSVTKLLSCVPIKLSIGMIARPLAAAVGSACALGVIVRVLGITSLSVAVLVFTALLFIIFYILLASLLSRGELKPIRRRVKLHRSA